MTDTNELFLVLIKILLALCSLYSLALLAFTIVKARTTQGSTAAIALSFTLFSWSTSVFLNLWMTNTVLEEATYALALLAAASLTWFTFNFQSQTLRRQVLLIVAPAIIFAFSVFIPGFIFSSTSLNANGLIETTSGIGYFIFHILFFCYLVIAIVKLISRRGLTRNATQRQQFVFLAVSITSFLLLKLFINIILGGFFDVRLLALLSPLMALIPLVTVYGVLTQYYYLDLKHVVYDFIGKIALFLFTGLTYLFALLMIGGLARGHNILTYHTAFIITLLASLKLATILEKEAILLAEGPRERAHKETVERFIVDLFEQQHTPLEISNASIQLCSDILSASSSQLVIQANGNERELILLENMRTSDSAFLEESTIFLLETTSAGEIGTPTPQEKFGEELRNIYGAALVATLSSQGTLYGLLILGERKDGRGYSKQDVALVQSILLPLASALAEATFRSRISSLTRSSDSETGKLREKIFQKNAKNILLIEGLQNSSREALYQIRHKVESISEYGVSAVRAALEAVERSTLEIERGIARLHTEALKPIIEQTDLAPLLHKLIEVYGARSLIEQSHLSYELPEVIPVIGDPQQIYEAIALLLQSVFSENCCRDEYITFSVSLLPNTIEIVLGQKYIDTQAKPSKTEWSQRQKCLMAYENPLAESLITRNNGILRGEIMGEREAQIHITLLRDTGEDRGGVLN